MREGKCAGPLKFHAFLTRIRSMAHKGLITIAYQVFICLPSGCAEAFNAIRSRGGEVAE